MRQESVDQVFAASQGGNPYATVKLALWLFEGRIVKQDKINGLALIKSMESSVVWAKDLLRYIRNPEWSNDALVSEHAIISLEATQQMEEASRQSDLYAMTALGELCYRGQTVPQDKETALEYLRAAGRMGCLWAQDLLQEFLLTNEQTPVKSPDGSVFDAMRHTSRISQLPANPRPQQDFMKELMGMIGLERVKEEVQSLRNFIKIQKQREEEGMKAMSVSYHCVFSGSPGTGKTTVARIVAGIYKELGILKKGHLVEVQRSDLVAEYVGQTATKTNAKIDEALDGVLFIDEAYTLSQGGQNDFGQEAINTLLKRMEDDRKCLVVILAGYSNEIKQFIATNPGLESRFNRYIHFEDYSVEDLMRIFAYNLQNAQYQITRKAYDAVFEIVYDAVQHKDDKFGNARYIRNIFERIIQKQADRLARKSGRVLKKELSLIKFADIENIND